MLVKDIESGKKNESTEKRVIVLSFWVIDFRFGRIAFGRKTQLHNC